MFWARPDRVFGGCFRGSFGSGICTFVRAREVMLYHLLNR